jgi:hypothetical protein
MPHLIDSDGEIYLGVPTNENRARERIKAQRTDFSQAYWDLPEKTLSVLIRMPLNEDINLIVKGQRQELAGPLLDKKDHVELTFDEIAGAYPEEEDPRYAHALSPRSTRT